MANFVLVHGAWTGGWVWREVAGQLRAAGHEVYTPTLTGLGERVHLGRPETGLDTHVTDIVNVINYEGLQDITLVGHSYSGIVVQGVAGAVPERLSGIVYVDCAPVEPGMALFDLFSDEGRAETEESADEGDAGWQLPFPGIDGLGEVASVAGLDDDALELMAERATPQPIETFRQPVKVANPYDGSYSRSLIACAKGDFTVQSIQDGIAAAEPWLQTIADPDWAFKELQTGHWPMLSMPNELATLLDELAR